MKPKFLIAIGLAAAASLASGPELAADVAAGEDVYKKKCRACHTVEQGQHKTGPSLFGVFGNKAGSTDFKRYKGLVGAEFVWDDKLLDEYLADPKAFVETHTANKTTAMTFKLPKEDERAAVIEYLKTVK